MEAESQLPFGRALRLNSAETHQSVTAPETILTLVNEDGSIAPCARASLQSMELEANARMVMTVSAAVTEPVCVEWGVRAPSDQESFMIANCSLQYNEQMLPVDVQAVFDSHARQLYVSVSLLLPTPQSSIGMIHMLLCRVR